MRLWSLKKIKTQITMIDLKAIFKEFCEYLNGKIKWAGKSRTFKKAITTLIFNFFEEKLSQKKD